MVQMGEIGTTQHAVRQPPQLGSKRTKTQNNRREPICDLGLPLLILYINRKINFFGKSGLNRFVYYPPCVYYNKQQQRLQTATGF
jgi:hypothetical protein